MHVAYLVNQYPKVSHTFIRREIHALERLGLKVTRFALRTDGTEQVDRDDAEEARKTRYVLKAGAAGILLSCLRAITTRPAKFFGALGTALRLGRRSDKGIARHLICLAEACVLLGWVKEAGATHLHTHFGTNSAVIALLYRKLGGVPYSLTIHGPEEFDSPFSLSLAEKVRGANFVVAISSYCRSQIMRWTEAGDWHKVRIVHCALEPAYFDSPRKYDGQSRKLVCVGRLSPEKGQMILLMATRQLLSVGLEFQLVLAGDGPLRSVLEAAIAKLGLAGNVRITGWISSEQVRTEISAARALVQPSFAEGLPVVIMEASAMGIPTISTYVAGIPELIRDGAGGWLVPAGDVESLAAAISAAFRASPDELSSRGNCARQRAIENHHADVEAAKLAALFTSGPPAE